MIHDISHYKEPLSISSSVKETANEDAASLLDLEHGMCFNLNPIGLKIWALLKQGHNIERIADMSESDFSVSRSQMIEDLCAFMVDLESKKLLFVRTGIADSGKQRGFWNRLRKRSNSG